MDKEFMGGMSMIVSQDWQIYIYGSRSKSIPRNVKPLYRPFT
ncbi:hypothetical protein ACE1CD_26275 [Aerosakkonema sp. BLCC-F183]